MNVMDLIILVIVCCFAFKGLLRGLVNEAATLAGLVVGGWLAYRFYPALAAPANSYLHLPAHLSSFLAFIAILLLTGICAHILGNIITAMLRLVLLGSLNRFGGVLLGAAEGAFLLSMVFSIASSGFMPEKIRDGIHESEPAHLLAVTGDQLLHKWRGDAFKKP